MKERKLIPNPLLSITLAILWLVLNESASLGHIALASILGMSIPWILQVFNTTTTVIRNPVAIAKLFGVVFKDVVVSNIDVAKLILGAPDKIRARFFWVPLSIQSDTGIAALASVITMTPGTLSAQLSNDRRFLLIHTISLSDDTELIDSIKTRYETPLTEIFS